MPQLTHSVYQEEPGATDKPTKHMKVYKGPIQLVKIKHMLFLVHGITTRTILQSILRLWVHTMLRMNHVPQIRVDVTRVFFVVEGLKRTGLAWRTDAPMTMRMNNVKVAEKT